MEIIYVLGQRQIGKTSNIAKTVAFSIMQQNKVAFLTNNNDTFPAQIRSFKYFKQLVYNELQDMEIYNAHEIIKQLVTLDCDTKDVDEVVIINPNDLELGTILRSCKYSGFKTVYLEVVTSSPEIQRGVIKV